MLFLSTHSLNIKSSANLILLGRFQPFFLRQTSGFILVNIKSVKICKLTVAVSNVYPPLHAMQVVYHVSTIVDTWQQCYVTVSDASQSTLIISPKQSHLHLS